jgi:hypothetical protein
MVKKKSPHFCEDFLKIGIDILSRALDQVPSALVGLTSLFGMGRGDPHRYRRHKGDNLKGFNLKFKSFKLLNFNLQLLNC